MSYNLKLPVYKVKDEIYKKINDNENLIIISETGSGKTTIIPQMLMENNKKKCIVCTQPRRVAAISIAKHVAKNVKTIIGKKVGYIVRYEDMTTKETELIYSTDGSLLRESLYDSELNRYTYIIIDEAHERSLHTDVLMGVVKRAQKLRNKLNKNPLKIIIMSATINVEKYEKYFNAKTFYIDGRQYPIDIYYTKNDPIDYFNATFTSIIQLHKELEIKNGILIFLTGQEEIESMKELLIDYFNNYKLEKAQILPLYSALSSNLQLKVFENIKNCRKIILATNIAETSITIPGINCVIDCGVVKNKIYFPENNIESLVISNISKAQARQRSGRAGRLSYGYCYRLYTEFTFFNKFNDDSIPEILRCNISYVQLLLISMGIKNLSNFEWFDIPNINIMKYSLEKLKLLNALDYNYNITNIGKEMIKFPIDPNFSKCIVISALENQCTDEIITLVCLLNEENLLYSNKNINSRINFLSNDGDIIMLLNLWKSYQTNLKQAKKNNKSIFISEWCQKFNINISCWKNAIKARSQMIKILLKSNYQLVNSNSLSIEQSSILIRKLMFQGLILNCAQLQNDSL